LKGGLKIKMQLESVLKKKHKRGSATQIMVSVLVVILVLGLAGFGYYMGTKKTSPQDSTSTPEGTGSGGIVDCGDNEPYITNDTSNALALSSKVAVTYYYAMDKNGNGEPDAGETFLTMTPGSSGSKFAVGDKLIIFSSATDYIDKYDSFEIKKCGQNTFSNEIYATDKGTLDLIDDSVRVSDVSTAVGTLNVSKSTSAGSPVSLVVELTGKEDESTGQLLITAEFNDTEASDMDLSEKSANAKVLDDDYEILNFFTAEGTAPTLRSAFLVDEIIQAKTVEYTLSINPESGMSIGGQASPLFVNVYSGQWFIDDDNTLQFGFISSEKTNKYEDKWVDHDAWIE